MRTRGWVLAIVVLVGLCLTGCGEKPPEPADGFERAPATPKPPAVVSKAKLGVLVPLSGADAAQGEAFVRGLKLGINTTGASVGLTEKALVIKDIADDADGGVAAATALLEAENPWVLLGMPNGKAAGKLSIQLKTSGIALLTMTTDELTLPVLESYVTRLTHPDSLETEVLADFVFGEARARQAVIIADSNDARSLATARTFRSTFEARTGIVQTHLSFGPAVKVQPLVRMVMHEKPDLVFLALGSEQATKFIDEARKQSLAARIAGPGWYSSSGFGTEGADYTAVITTGRDFMEDPTNLVLEQMKRERVIANITEPLTEAELVGYDAAVVLVNALAAAKDPKELATAISRTKDLAGTRGPLSMGLGRMLSGTVKVLTVTGRTFKLSRLVTAEPLSDTDE